MSEWAWVALGYGTTGVAVAGYLITLLRGAAAVRRRAKDPR